MNNSSGQRGITLLEVLVGFVIFTVSLVAVLDHVSAQIFHQYKSDSKLSSFEEIYNRAAKLELAQGQRDGAAADTGGTSITLTSREIESSDEENDAPIVLNSHDFRSGDRGADRIWSVLRLNQEN